MNGISVAASSVSSSFSVDRQQILFVSLTRKPKSLNFSSRRKSRVLVLASNESPKFDEWDQMELKFGRLLGEDPKLTMAKIMGRKLDPGLSCLDIEKEFNRKKGKLRKKDRNKVPLITSMDQLSSLSLNGVDFIPSVPEKETKFEEKSKSPLNLVRPVPRNALNSGDMNKTSTEEKNKPEQSASKALENTKGTIPNVILRKPSKYYEDNEDAKELLRFGVKPNPSLKMGNDPKRQNFTDITLLRKPEPSPAKAENVKLEASDDSTVFNTEQYPMVDKLEMNDDVEKNSLASIHVSPEAARQPDKEHHESGDGSTSLENSGLVDSNSMFSSDASLQEKPERLDIFPEETSNHGAMETINENSGPEAYAVESVENIAATLKGQEDIDWQKAEDLSKNDVKVEVELINSTPKGFIVSFASLIGFLPYRNVVARLKFLAFESWLRSKGVNPFLYKKSIGIIGDFKVHNKNTLGDSSPDRGSNSKIVSDISPDMKLDALLEIYDQERNRFLSSFVSEKMKVNVILVDRKARKLVFSMKPKGTEGLVEKKRALMAKLSIGDVVKCCITKITYFGIFVEIEGVSALIHQTEVSWDASLDPTSYFKIGQILEAKVCQLDFSLERILLSLKEITPDPLIEALECVVGDRNCFDGRLEGSQEDTEWDDMESLIRELQNIKGIDSVSKGRFFHSPGLAPTFQVYMASLFENQYKLLARFGNKVQEVMVEASLQKEEMKSAIHTCTNRVQ